MRFRSFSTILALGAVAGSACTSVTLLPSAAPIDLVVAATTDIHGRVRGWDYYADAPDSVRGLARVATIIDSLRKVSPVLPIVVDAGDFLQGNPMAYLAARVDTTMPNPIIAAMNVIQYDAVTIGNHEFNYGLPALTRAMRQAEFTMLAANARRPDGSPRFALCAGDCKLLRRGRRRAEPKELWRNHQAPGGPDTLPLSVLRKLCQIRRSCRPVPCSAPRTTPS